MRASREACGKDTRTHRSSSASNTHFVKTKVSGIQRADGLHGDIVSSCETWGYNDIQLATSWRVSESSDLADEVIEHHYWPPCVSHMHRSLYVLYFVSTVCSTEVMSYPGAVLDVSKITIQALGTLDNGKGCMIAVEAGFGDTESVCRMNTCSPLDICPTHPCDRRSTKLNRRQKPPPPRMLVLTLSK